MIITTQRHPVNLWIDRLLTIVGWLAFSYLVAQGMLLALRHALTRSGLGPMDPIFPTFTTFFFYGCVLICNGLLLWAWSRWHQRETQQRLLQHQLHQQRHRAKESALAQEKTVPFALDQIEVTKQHQVVVLHHSLEGAVEHVETPLTPAAMQNQEPTPTTIQPLRLHSTKTNRPTPKPISVATAS